MYVSFSEFFPAFKIYIDLLKGLIDMILVFFFQKLFWRKSLL